MSLDSGAGLSNATLQQRLVPVRLFFDFLVEEGIRESNPVGRGRYTPGRSGGGTARGLLPRMVKLPWIPAEAEWSRVLEVFRAEPVRNRLMLALAYDLALRRKELCSLRTDDIDPAHRTLRVRAETTKTRQERIVPYSASTGVLLDVPVNKTSTAFTKPVDPIVGQAIEAWQHLRPTQSRRLDPKTNERVDLLFSVRAHPVAKNYINRTLIPSLCEKAGVPTSDVRGNITSHRARSTIASQLYNAKEPMTLFELQAWLGHRSPVSTQHYAKITPNTLTRAYTEAGYFSRNLRTIEVLVDREAVTSGAVSGGNQPWQYYDLGHGYCTYSFFEQCQHRMACARCDFYTPKDSTRAQLLEAKANLQRMLVSIPLTDDERAAVDDGQTALDALLARLAGPHPCRAQPPRPPTTHDRPTAADHRSPARHRMTKPQVTDSTEWPPSWTCSPVTAWATRWAPTTTRPWSARR